MREVQEAGELTLGTEGLRGSNLVGGMNCCERWKAGTSYMDFKARVA